MFNFKSTKQNEVERETEKESVKELLRMIRNNFALLPPLSHLIDFAKGPPNRPAVLAKSVCIKQAMFKMLIHFKMFNISLNLS